MSARDARLARMKKKLAAHGRPAWRVSTQDGDGLDASKLGGAPMAGGPDDLEGLRLLIQLRGEDLPEGLGFPKSRIVQVFWSHQHRGDTVRAPGYGGVRIASFDRPGTIEERSMAELPARRIVGFESFDDVPRWADMQNLGVRLNAKEMRLAQDASPEDRLKVGGWPDWIQGPAWPEPGWRLLLQLHGEQAGVDFGDTGLGYLTFNPDAPDEIAFGWSST